MTYEEMFQWLSERSFTIYSDHHFKFRIDWYPKDYPLDDLHSVHTKLNLLIPQAVNFEKEWIKNK